MQKPELTPFTLWLMTITTGLVVANIYYSQPLLTDIALAFKVSSQKAGQVAMFTQFGYAAGLLFIVPLGDMFERKKLMLLDFGLLVFSLIGLALAPSILVLCIFSFFTGLSSVITQLLVPMAAHLAKPEERGKKIGLVMSGLLTGILLSRTFSGIVAAHFGWRAIYYFATGMMLILWLLIYLLLPPVSPTYRGTYTDLMKSLYHLFVAEPKLRLAIVRGACCFAGFSAFWSTLIFLLASPAFHKGSATAGAFGLIGAFGAIGANFVGRLGDKMNKDKVLVITLSSVILSFVLFYFSGQSIAGLIIGVVLMDMGVQATHITNQSIIFSIQPDARNRVNTVYMVSYFIGGAAGTLAATQLWGLFHWRGVCITGFLFAAVALLTHCFLMKRQVTVTS